MGMTRRDALKGLGAVVGAAAIGCGSDSAAIGPGEYPDASPPDGSPPPPDATEVNACTAESSMTPRELLAHIDTFVVLCMENRSFDHYLGSLRLAEGRMDIDGLTGSESNLDPSGQPVKVFRLEDYTVE